MIKHTATATVSGDRMTIRARRATLASTGNSRRIDPQVDGFKIYDGRRYSAERLASCWSTYRHLDDAELANQSLATERVREACASTTTTAELTFRKGRRETGLAAIAQPKPNTAIRMGDARIGTIHAPVPHGKQQWSITLMVVDAASHCSWRTVRLTHSYPDEPAARAALRGGETTLRPRHHFHALTD